ncbi:hypothetical protein CEXT_684261 [Caerostris extrusa]|uniref:Uncharacterized protein n=1 Tax=Caerostris extrusa TaxID=172846 RepID=A0AAV4TBJ4_CAEEX|nr:hypothetical protein CEXT_684261 [Caerostris extrusa]
MCVTIFLRAGEAFTVTSKEGLGWAGSALGGRSRLPDVRRWITDARCLTSIYQLSSRSGGGRSESVGDTSLLQALLQLPWSHFHNGSAINSCVLVSFSILLS